MEQLSSWNIQKHILEQSSWRNNVNHHHTRVLQSPDQIILPKVITSCQGNVNVYIYAPRYSTKFTNLVIPNWGLRMGSEPSNRPSTFVSTGWKIGAFARLVSQAAHGIRLNGLPKKTQLRAQNIPANSLVGYDLGVNGINCGSFET